VTGAPLRIGVVGPGDVATRDYLPEMGRLAGRAEIVAFASHDGERARAAAARFGGARAYAGYVALVRDGAPTAASAEHARHVVDIIESGYRAAETGMTQPLRTSFDPV
jgi:predicted dehydrogenase